MQQQQQPQQDAWSVFLIDCEWLQEQQDYNNNNKTHGHMVKDYTEWRRFPIKTTRQSNYYKDNKNNIEDLVDIIYIDRGTFFAWIVTRVYIDNKIVIWKQLCDEDIDNTKPVKPL